VADVNRNKRDKETTMIWNYLKITLRTIKKHKGYAAINMAGLVIGMAVAMLIMLWVASELSYDRFHTHSDHIHRVYVDLVAGTHMTLALSMPELAHFLIEEFPEVKNAARISRPGRTSVKFKDREFYENLVCYGDTALFEVFDFPFLKGNPKSALQAPYTAVITQETAEKYFGNEDPIGQILRIGGVDDYAVNGVVADVPPNSHFRFNIVRSFATLYTERRRDMENWLNIQYYTYLLLSEGSEPKAVEQKLPAIVEKHLGPTLKAMGGTLTLFLQPLEKIHLFSKIGGDIAAQGDITYIILFSGIGLFVLLLACINFINLSTARSSTRFREIGIRKTLGSSRKSLIYQFLGESLFYSIISFILAGIVISSTQPWQESLLGRPLSANILHTPWLLPGFACLSLIAGLLAGSYPSFYLSAFQPVYVLKSGFSGGGTKSRFRNILVVFQFAVSIVLIIGTITVYRQVHYMKTKNLGFNTEHVLVIPGAQSLLRQMNLENVKDEFLKVPGVASATGSALVPTRGVQNFIFYPEGFTREQPQKLIRLDIDAQYIPTMNIEILSGRNFSEDLPTDPSTSVLINETAAHYLGWTDPLGKTLTFVSEPGGSEMVTRQVVGVAKDFHFTSLHSRIEPLVIVYNPLRINYISLRIIPDNIPATVSHLKKTWDTLNPERPFDYFFLDTSFDNQYRAEERVGSLSLYFSLLAIFIGCLGLFGLAAYMADRRTKEIGIRKVLGASAPGIVRLLSKEFFWLVVLASILAWPVSYLGLSLWLRNFPYRVNIHWLVMVSAGFLALATALTTVSFQAIKAAVANPVEALRYE